MNIYPEMNEKAILCETVYNNWYAIENITHMIEILNSWNS